MTSDETQTQIFADWPMSQPRDKGQQKKYRISRPCREKETADETQLCNKVETAVHGCNLAFSLDSIASVPR